jgi:hypothetical protein
MNVNFQNYRNVLLHPITSIQNMSLRQGVVAGIAITSFIALGVCFKQVILTSQRAVVLTGVMACGFVIAIAKLWNNNQQNQIRLPNPPPVHNPIPPINPQPAAANQQAPLITNPLHLLIRNGENLDTVAVQDFFNQHPEININEVDSGNRTPLYRAIWKRYPSIALINELMNRGAQYSPGHIGISLEEFQAFFQKTDSPSVAILGILKGLKENPNKHLYVDYILALSLADVQPFAPIEGEHPFAALRRQHQITEDGRLSRIAADVILEFQQMEIEDAIPFYRELANLQQLGDLPHELRDPTQIIMDYLKDTRNANDVNKVANNLQNLRREAGYEIEDVTHEEEKKNQS